MRLILGLAFVTASMAAIPARAEEPKPTCEMSLNAWGCNKGPPPGAVHHTEDNPAGMWGNPQDGKPNDEKKIKTKVSDYIADNHKRRRKHKLLYSPDNQKAFEDNVKPPEVPHPMPPIADNPPPNNDDDHNRRPRPGDGAY